MFKVDGEECERIDDHGVPHLRYERVAHAAVLVGSIVYIVGGINSKGAVVHCEAINLQTCQHHDMAPITDEATINISTVHYDGWIYAVGGASVLVSSIDMTFNTTNAVRLYSIANNTWLQITNPDQLLQFPRFDHCIFIHQNRLFVFGGNEKVTADKNTGKTMEGKLVNNMEIFDLTKVSARCWYSERNIRATDMLNRAYGCNVTIETDEWHSESEGRN